MPSSGKVPSWAIVIKSLRTRKKMSQAALAERAGTTQSNVAKWERGAYRPSPMTFMKLSKIFEGEPESLGLMEWGGVPKEFFFGETHPDMIPVAMAEAAINDAKVSRAGELAAAGVLRGSETSFRMVPLLAGSAAAGTPRLIADTDVTRFVPVPDDWLPSGGRLYAFKVEGDSMDPILLTGHIVIVDTSENKPRSLINRMVAAEDDGVTIKWLREDGDDLMLVPHNVSVRHPVKRLKPGMRIIGPVVKWIGEPPPVPKKRQGR